MKLGMFGQAFHPPGKSPYDCQEWDLQVIRWMDEFGYDEAWFGEHHALPWEPNPAPDILIAQAFRETKRIRLGPGGICLPYHNPAVVANRMAWLDHVSQGRLNFGVAAGSVPADWKLLGINGADTRDMTRESLEIIQKIWFGERPFVYEGKYWRIEVEEPRMPLFDAHIKPLQKGGPPIGVSGLSPNSPTLKIAGKMGFLPMSLNADITALKSHWDTYVEGAESAGRTANRADWRVCKEVIVAETDAKAEKIAVEGALGHFAIEYLARMSKIFSQLQGLPALNIPEEQLSPQFLVHDKWLVGSPATVREKLEKYQYETGGFGTLLVFACDYAEQPEAWRDSLRLLAEEVVPKMAGTVPAAVPAE
jgi:alkanesulfonate monooxygenase SsuD/methylene tetrahydromethanopterin reductase-like flavin-dependent oxidoreductase (luciferase family)